ncbi:MAG: YdgA family protein, partial [Helicobacteraceae bacterium]|nr:YdgA family protein [Helicobacteraceae bacterium]
AVIAIIAIATPIFTSFVTQGYFAAASGDIRSPLPEPYKRIFAQVPINLTLEQKSYDRGLFSAKAVSTIVFSESRRDGRIGSESEILTIESDLSFGWYLSSDFPYLHLVKSHTTFRLSDELRKQARIVFDDGKVLEGDIYFTPNFAGKGVFATPATSFQEARTTFDIKPIKIAFNYSPSDNSPHIEIDLSLLSFTNRNDKVLFEGIRLVTDGNVLDINDDSKYKLLVKKAVITDLMKLENLKIDNAQTIKGDFINGFGEFSADRLAIQTRPKYDYISRETKEGKLITIDKPFLSIKTDNFDHKSLTKLYEVSQSLVAARRQDLEKAQAEVYALATKLFENAIITVKSSANFDRKPFEINAVFKLDPKIPFPQLDELEAYGAEKLLKKLIANVDISINQKIAEIFDAPNDFYDGIDTLVKESYLKREGDILSAIIHLENGDISINDKAPNNLENLFSNQRSQRALIASEKYGIASARSYLQAIRGRAIASGAGQNVRFKTLDCGGNQHTVTILPYNDAAPNDETRLNKLSYPNGLSLRSWQDPIPSRDSSDGECSTALALVLEPEERKRYTTEALGEKTKIKGPATSSITYPNAELNVDRYWLYDPKTGTIQLQ